MRGAAFLTNTADSLVVDVEGTSTDVGVLVNGFPQGPRGAWRSAGCGPTSGCRTWSRSRSAAAPKCPQPQRRQIGPQSVGYLRDALVFGGKVPTLTDGAVATGRASLGDPRLASSHRALLTEAVAQADVMLSDAIDRMKTAKGDRALIAVGGGSILLPDRIPGVSEVIRPEHFDAANAVGAAIASVSGQVDRIFHLGPGGRQAVLDEACEEARERAVAAGADPRTVEIVEREEIPLAYLTTPAVRVRAKAAGTLGGLPDHQLEANLSRQARLAGATEQAAESP